MAHDWSSSKNKVKYITNFISLIHSLDRISLAKEIDKYAKNQTEKLIVLYNSKFLQKKQNLA